MTKRYFRDIEERPKITTELPEYFKPLLDQLNQFVLRKTVETQQTIADMRASQPAFKENEPTRQIIEDILDLTDNGKDLWYDDQTQAAINNSGERDSIIKRDGPNNESKMRDVALLGLSIYAERVSDYKQQNINERKHRGRIA